MAALSHIALPVQWTSADLLQAVIDTIPDPIFVKDRQHRWVACNQAFCQLLGHPYDAIIGHSDPDLWPAEQAAVFWRGDDVVFESGEPNENEEQATGTDGVTRTIWTRKFPMRDERGSVVGLSGIIIDITEVRRRQDEVARVEAKLAEQQRQLAVQEAKLAEQQRQLAVQEAEMAEKLAIIEAQDALLDQLSVPVIQVWDNVLLLPLMGVLDSRRANQVMETMLTAISRASAQVVILDITGVPVVDTSVASHLVRSIQAAQLLGCQSMIVGISPEIAQTLVTLGVDFSHIAIRATLQNGLEYALRQRSAGAATFQPKVAAARA